MFLKRLHINLPKKTSGANPTPYKSHPPNQPKTNLQSNFKKTGKLWSIAPFSSMISIFKMIPRSSQNICPTPKNLFEFSNFYGWKFIQVWNPKNSGGSSLFSKWHPRNTQPTGTGWSSKFHPQPPVRPWHSPNPHPASYLPHFARPALQPLGPAGRTSARRGRRGDLRPRGRWLPAVPQGDGADFYHDVIDIFHQKHVGDWMVIGWWLDGDAMIIQYWFHGDCIVNSN